MSVTAAMPFHFSSPEYLSHHRPRKNRLSPVSRASPAHMNSPIVNVRMLYSFKRQRRFEAFNRMFVVWALHIRSTVIVILKIIAHVATSKCWSFTSIGSTLQGSLV